MDKELKINRVSKQTYLVEEVEDMLGMEVEAELHVKTPDETNVVVGMSDTLDMVVVEVLEVNT